MLRTFLDLQSSLRGASLIFSKGLRLQQHDLVARAERLAQVSLPPSLPDRISLTTSVCWRAGSAEDRPAVERGPAFVIRRAANAARRRRPGVEPPTTTDAVAAAASSDTCDRRPARPVRCPAGCCNVSSRGRTSAAEASAGSRARTRAGHHL